MSGDYRCSVICQSSIKGSIDWSMIIDPWRLAWDDDMGREWAQDLIIIWPLFNTRIGFNDQKNCFIVLNEGSWNTLKQNTLSYILLSQEKNVQKVWRRKHFPNLRLPAHGSVKAELDFSISIVLSELDCSNDTRLTLHCIMGNMQWNLNEIQSKY